MLRMLLRRQLPVMRLPVSFSFFRAHLAVAVAHGFHARAVAVMHAAAGTCVSIVPVRLRAAGQEQGAGGEDGKGG